MDQNGRVDRTPARRQRTIRRRRPWPRKDGDELTELSEMHVVRLPQYQRALDGAKHVALLSSQ